MKSLQALASRGAMEGASFTKKKRVILCLRSSQRLRCLGVLVVSHRGAGWYGEWWKFGWGVMVAC